MPSIASALPLGLKRMSIVGASARSTYCVMICPFAASFWMSASLATNLPSPCEMGTLNTSPALTPESHGDFAEATLTRTMRDWWRPMSL